MTRRQHRANINPLKVAIPLKDAFENVEGWYQFPDVFLSPEVQYTTYPATTRVKFGGRYLELDRPVAIKIRLLEEEEDHHFWTAKKQHSQRINCGEFHRDFGDVEIGYSFSTPQTHIWFAGYSVHADAFENITLTSHSATVRVTPEHLLLPTNNASLSENEDDQKENKEKESTTKSMDDLVVTRSLFEMVMQEGADLPIYTAAVPQRVETYKGYVTQLMPTAEFINDCEREIVLRDAWDAGAAISQLSNPVSSPPTFPAIEPFEHSGIFWSFIRNRLLAMRLSRDALEQAFADAVLLKRLQQYDYEAIKHDRKYQKALDRLSTLFEHPDTIHKATWPVRPGTTCRCTQCKERKQAKRLIRERTEALNGRPYDQSRQHTQKVVKQDHLIKPVKHRPAIKIDYLTVEKEQSNLQQEEAIKNAKIVSFPDFDDKEVRRAEKRLSRIKMTDQEDINKRSEERKQSVTLQVVPGGLRTFATKLKR